MAALKFSRKYLKKVKIFKNLLKLIKNKNLFYKKTLQKNEKI